MDKSAITLERMRTFVRVAERGSFTAVARELGVGQSTVTRQLRELEEAVGAPLVIRTTRRVSMTDEGNRYYTSSVQVLRLAEQAAEEVRGGRDGAVGTIRLSCTASFGVLHASKLIFDFQDHNPGITVDLSLTDRRVDLVQEGVDIALRLGPLSDSSLKLLALGRCRRLLVAAPSYLASRGTPEDPDGLAGHQGVRMSNVAGSEVLALRGPDDQTHVATLDGRFRVDLALALREALLAGRGIGHAHQWLVDDLLATGELRELLPDYRLPHVPLNMLIVPERSRIGRVRLLVDFLAERVRAVPGIE